MKTTISFFYLIINLIYINSNTEFQTFLKEFTAKNLNYVLTQEMTDFILNFISKNNEILVLISIFFISIYLIESLYDSFKELIYRIRLNNNRIRFSFWKEIKIHKYFLTKDITRETWKNELLADYIHIIYLSWNDWFYQWERFKAIRDFTSEKILPIIEDWLCKVYWFKEIWWLKFPLITQLTKKETEEYIENQNKNKIKPKRVKKLLVW